MLNRFIFDFQCFSQHFLLLSCVFFVKERRGRGE